MDLHSDSARRCDRIAPEKLLTSISPACSHMGTMGISDKEGGGGHGSCRDRTARLDTAMCGTQRLSSNRSRPNTRFYSGASSFDSKKRRIISARLIDAHRVYVARKRDDRTVRAQTFRV